MSIRRRYSAFLGIFFFLICSSVKAVGVPTGVTVVVVPDAPSNLTAVPDTPDQVTLSWTDNANGNEDGFSIERKVGVTGTYAVIATTTASVATYIDNSPSPATTYFYRVQAFIGIEDSSYSNEASVTTPSAPLPPPSSGGGGGGGGGGGPVTPAPSVFQTGATFKGIAYPGSNVTLIQNGQVVAVTQAGPDAKFEIDASNMAPGSYNFGIWGLDPSGNRSITQTFNVTLTNGATTVISGIFLPPTIGVDKIEVKKGDVVTILGYTAPQTTVTVMVHSEQMVMANVTSTNTGSWIYQLSTDLLDYGDHTATAHAASSGAVTTDSNLVTFTVGTTDVAAPTSTPVSSAADLNGDGKVNLIDFSIMAYWFGRPNPPASVDINHDGVVNLVDFSILAYYWTG